MNKEKNARCINVAVVGHPYQSQKLRIFFDQVYEYFKKNPDTKINCPDSFPVKETK